MYNGAVIHEGFKNSAWTLRVDEDQIYRNIRRMIWRYDAT